MNILTKSMIFAAVITGIICAPPRARNQTTFLPIPKGYDVAIFFLNRNVSCEFKDRNRFQQNIPQQPMAPLIQMPDIINSPQINTAHINNRRQLQDQQNNQNALPSIADKVNPHGNNAQYQATSQINMPEMRSILQQSMAPLIQMPDIINSPQINTAYIKNRHQSRYPAINQQYDPNDLSPVADRTNSNGKNTQYQALSQINVPERSRISETAERFPFSSVAIHSLGNMKDLPYTSLDDAIAVNKIVGRNIAAINAQNGHSFNSLVAPSRRKLSMDKYSEGYNSYIVDVGSDSGQKIVQTINYKIHRK